MDGRMLACGIILGVLVGVLAWFQYYPAFVATS